MRISKLNKKEILCIVIIAIVSCLLIFVSNNFYYYGDDLSYHLNRIIGMIDAIKEGQIIPRIYPNINYGYGYGSALFYCDLFLYPFVLLSFLGISAIDIFRITIVFYSLLAAFSSMYFSKHIFKESSSCIIFTCLFVLSNYRLYDVYNRAALGEIIAISFIPFVLLSMYRVLVLKENNYLSFGLSFSALVLSHLISAVLCSALFLLFIIIFCIENYKNMQEIKNAAKTVIKAVIIAVLLCAWFLLPMLEQIRSQDFYCFLFESSYGSYPRTESISNLINPINGKNIFDISLFFISYLYLFLRKKNKIVSLLLIISSVLFLIMTGYIPFLHQISFIQFMFRLNIIIYPFVIIVDCYLLDNIDNNYKKYICIIFSILFIINLFNKYTFLLKDSNNIVKTNELNKIITYDQEQFYYNKKQLGGGEYLPVCNDVDYLHGERNIILADVKGNYLETFSNFEKNSSHISFDYEGESEFASIPLTYYKGYQAKCDGKKIQCVDDYLYKRVGLYLQSGKHHYEVYYGGTLIQKVSLLVSSLTLVYIIFKTFKSINR